MIGGLVDLLATEFTTLCGDVGSVRRGCLGCL
jgi:hypothetical protein